MVTGYSLPDIDAVAGVAELRDGFEVGGKAIDRVSRRRSIEAAAEPVAVDRFPTDLEPVP